MKMSYCFELENCNNIRKAEITIKKKELNIKYGVNGTGKSTISKAIEMFASGGDVNSELHTFGCTEDSKITCDSVVNKVAIFDEDYINTLVFDKNEVIKDSFNIFIKSPNYDERMNKLNKRLKDLKIDLLGSEKVDALINIFNTVSSKLVLNTSKELKKNPFFKSIVTDKNLYNIPSKLKKYEIFLINNEKNIEWIDWKTKGHNFDDISGCPFCTEKLANDYDEEKQIFSSNFKKSTASNLKEMLRYFEELEEYINEGAYKSLIKCIKEIEDAEAIELELKRFTQEMYYLKDKLNKIQDFNSFTVKQSDIGKVDDILKSLVINVGVLNIFTSEKMCELIGLINSKISQIRENVAELKSELGQLRGYIQATVQKYKNDINDFLKSAGIKYKVQIDVNGENDALTTLHYVGEEGVLNPVGSIKKHLSWGEKNAFALVLFMFDAISKDPDLIILDDPISSFDSNKKYAIINRLFANGQQDSFYKKTVLMLTHDFEPVIDFVINKKPTGGYVNAKFIKNNNGLISEKVIEKNEGIDSYIKMLINYSKDSMINPVSRLVFLRQLIEHIQSNDSESLAYNIISSLVHGEEIPLIKDSQSEIRPATEEEYRDGELFIKSFTQDFEYGIFYASYFNVSYLKLLYEELDNNYLKLQIFRTYIDIAKCRVQLKDDVILKFIDEIYHIENDYIYYLDVLNYDIVPDYIITKCNDFFQNSLSAIVSA